jgi:hypothetical protein
MKRSAERISTDVSKSRRDLKQAIRAVGRVPPLPPFADVQILGTFEDSGSRE